MNRQIVWGVIVLAGGSAVAGIAACGGGDSTTPPQTYVDAGAPPAAELAIDKGQADFGLNDCGGAAPAEFTVTLSNPGQLPLTYTATLDSVQYFTIDGPATGTINPAASATLKIQAKAVASSAQPGQAFRATVTIASNDTSKPKLTIPVTMAAQGGVVTVNPSVADFGLVPVGAQATDIPLAVTNTGNKQVQVAFGTPSSGDFSVTPASGSVDPGKTLAGLVARYKPSAASVQPVKASVPMTVTGALCGVPPNNVSLVGQGGNGGITYQPGTLDFGNTPCQTQGTSKTFTVANLGNQAFTWNAALTLGAKSPYVMNPEGGIALPGSAMTVTITPKPLPFPADTSANKYGDTVTLTTNITGDSPHTIALKQTALGATLSYTGAVKTSLGAVAIGNTASWIQITNSGNAPSTVTFSPGSNANAAMTIAPVTVGANGGQATATVSLQPWALGTINENIAIDTQANPPTGPLCAPLPQPTSTAATVVSYDVPTAVYAGDFETVVAGGAWWGQGRDFNGQALLTGISSTSSMSFDQSGGVCFVRSDQYVQCQWGPYGKSPVLVSGLSKAVVVTAPPAGGSNDNVTCAAKSDGTAWCWTPGGGSPFAVQVTGISKASVLSMQAVDYSDGLDRPYLCWAGSGTSVQCGAYQGVGNPLTNVVTVGAISASALAAGLWHTCAIDANKAVWCWGYDALGQLGNTTNNDAPPANPASVTLGAGATSIASGFAHTCVALTNNQAWCWGYDGYGQLGDGTFNTNNTPVQVPNTSVASVAAGRFHTCAMLKATPAQVACWGYNADGEVAPVNYPQFNYPYVVPFLSAH